MVLRVLGLHEEAVARVEANAKRPETMVPMDFILAVDRLV